MKCLELPQVGIGQMGYQKQQGAMVLMKKSHVVCHVSVLVVLSSDDEGGNESAIGHAEVHARVPDVLQKAACEEQEDPDSQVGGKLRFFLVSISRTLYD